MLPSPIFQNLLRSLSVLYHSKNTIRYTTRGWLLLDPLKLISVAIPQIRKHQTLREHHVATRSYCHSHTRADTTLSIRHSVNVHEIRSQNSTYFFLRQPTGNVVRLRKNLFDLITNIVSVRMLGFWANHGHARD